tara:strand:+ start:4133 stop:5077 length:945 start_codon:yes stop_codon:yes gene_type:complete
MIKDDLYIYTFYRFLNIKNKKHIKSLLDTYFSKKLLRGTILLANEGINCSISGIEKDLLETVKLIKNLLNIRKLNIKVNTTDFLPFNRIKVRLKNEIVSLGKGEMEVNKLTGSHILPSEWNKIIQKKGIKLIDTRNSYEIDIGKFKGAINPKTKSFREFPAKLNKIGIKKNDKIAIYCTGGIRCEKASAYLKLKGYKDIVQLNGGIINYLKHVKENNRESFWQGECFVFDNRVTVKKNLTKGNYLQCHGCRHPITKDDTKLKSYRKGISCKYCYKKRKVSQIKRSATRQNQIDIAEIKGVSHSFKKIKIQDVYS